MRYGNVTFGQIAAFLLVLSLGLPIPSKAGVYWDETFESPLNAGGRGPWITDMCSYMNPSASPWPDGCNPIRSTTVAHGGSYSLDHNFTYNNGLDTGVSIWRGFTAGSAVYTRFWIYLDKDYSCCLDTPSPKNGQGKMYFVRNEAYQSGVDFSMIVDMKYGRNISLQLEAPSGMEANFNDTLELNRNRWYCVEVFINAGTAGTANGAIQTWIDGAQRLNLSNLRITPKGRSNLMNTIGIFAQTADGGHRYLDDFAVGNTRIGCGATPTISVPPPTGLIVR